MSLSGKANSNGPIRAHGAFVFNRWNLNRLIGRGGRIADTFDPSRYADVLRRLLPESGDNLRFGFMLPINLLLDGVVNHDLYHQPRVPQFTPMAIFGQLHGVWRLRAVLIVSSGTREESKVCETLSALYGDFGVGLIMLTSNMIDAGYLQTNAFAHRLDQALFCPEAVSSHPLSPARESAVA